VRFDPVNGSVQLMNATLGPLCAAMGADTDGTTAYLFGGVDSTSYRDEIVAYNFGPDHAHAVIAPVPPQECSDGGARVTLDGRGSSDPLGRPLTYVWGAPGIAFDAPDASRATATFPLGDTRVTLAVHSDSGWGFDAVTVRVQDTRPPALELVTPAPGHVYLPSGVQASEEPPLADPVAVGPLTLRAIATDECGVRKVDFRVIRTDPVEGEIASRTDRNVPYEFEVDPTAAESGAFQASAAVTDLGNLGFAETVTYTHVGTRTS
jgi:hypothetical protein